MPELDGLNWKKFDPELLKEVARRSAVQLETGDATVWAEPLTLKVIRSGIMNQLEQTIIANARQEAVAVLSFYKAKQAGQATADDAADYLGHFNALNALLTLAHQANSGMSTEGVKELLVIEEENAAAFRGLVE